MHQNPRFAVQAIRARARGDVTKTRPPEALLRAVFEVLNGRIVLSRDSDHELALSRLADETAADVLTAREFEVLRMLLAERDPGEIANKLHLSPKTVANMCYLIKCKLRIGSDIELVGLALHQEIMVQAEFDEAKCTRGQHDIPQLRWARRISTNAAGIALQ